MPLLENKIKEPVTRLTKGKRKKTQNQNGKRWCCNWYDIHCVVTEVCVGTLYCLLIFSINLKLLLKVKVKKKTKPCYSVVSNLFFLECVFFKENSIPYSTAQARKLDILLHTSPSIIPCVQCSIMFQYTLLPEHLVIYLPLSMSISNNNMWAC